LNSEHDTSTANIESTLPRPWEVEQGFDDVLYEWMQRAPWLALSALAHALVLLILMAIPWELLSSRNEHELVMILDAPQEEPFVEPPEEPPPEIEPEVPPEDPVLQDASLDEPVDETDFDELPSELDSLFANDFTSDQLSDLAVIGLGKGWGSGPGQGHFGNRGRGRIQPGKPTVIAIGRGLQWLRDHQAPDGHWSGAGFMHENALSRSCACDGAGQEVHDVGLTGLALLAFLGDGNTTRQGPYKEVVARGIRWLRDAQDSDTGLYGPRRGHGYVYDHAIATLAMCEAWYFTHNPLVGASAQKGIDFVLRARNPYSAWRYEVPPNGESDTSVTGWMVMALTSARDGGLKVDETAFEGARSWLDEVTDTETGRVGYTAIGSLSSRIPRVNDHFPPEKGEAMTAVGLLSRFFLGQEPRALGGEDEIMDRHAELLLTSLPKWDPDGRGCDMYYWYYGSYAMYQMGGSRWWAPWNKAMKQAVVDSQRADGDLTGSWDPVGPWGSIGGRVYSTALMVLSLEVYYRYARILGAR